MLNKKKPTNSNVSPKKILFLSHRIPYPPNKGEKIRTFNQIKFLAELGHDIHVISPIEDSIEIAFAQQLSEFKNISVTIQALPPKALRLFKGFMFRESLSVANFYSFKLQQKINQLIQKKNFDYILCSSSAVAKYIYKTNCSDQVQLLMDFMDLDSDKWQQYANKSSFPMRWVYQREAKKLCKYENAIQENFDACFFIADTEVALFKKNNPNANNVLPLGNGLNIQEFYPAKIAPQNENPVFVFTGVMDYKPNVDAVIWFIEKCWQQLISHFPSARLVIAGMNPSLEIKKLSTIKGIEITGYVDDILPYYHQADYFIAPFRLARGVQNKILQAFACGLPVIATPMGAEGINCHDNQEILLANTPDEFINKVLLLDKSTQLRKKISDAALSLIKNEYSWEGKLKPLQDLIEYDIGIPSTL
jgi:sugar transferase (PEP-CTERM/EpsH1 system associated)